MIAESARPWYEDAFGPHYALLYAHRGREEATRCLDLLARLADLNRGPILDLGCGTGRHLRYMAERGIPALGLDLSAALLGQASRAVPKSLLVRGDMRSLPLRSAMFGAVLSLFTTFGYFGTAAQHRPLVREIARVLKNGGHWCLDFLDSERIAAELAAEPGERTRDLGPLRVREVRVLAPRPRRVLKTVLLEAAHGRLDEAMAWGVGPRGLRYVEEVTLLSINEILDLAAGAGMRLVASAGDYHGAPLVPGNSERWLFVFARNPAGGGPA